MSYQLFTVIDENRGEDQSVCRMPNTFNLELLSLYLRVRNCCYIVADWCLVVCYILVGRLRYCLSHGSEGAIAIVALCLLCWFLPWRHCVVLRCPINCLPPNQLQECLCLVQRQLPCLSLSFSIVVINVVVIAVIICVFWITSPILSIKSKRMYFQILMPTIIFRGPWSLKTEVHYLVQF